MMRVQELLNPPSKGNAERGAGFTVDRIIEIHRFMVEEMQRILQEFSSLPAEVRHGMNAKGCETTAELLVSVAVEQQLGVHCEDVERAVARHAEDLQEQRAFVSCTEQLASLMQRLVGAVAARQSEKKDLGVEVPGRELQHGKSGKGHGAKDKMHLWERLKQGTPQPEE